MCQQLIKLHNDTLSPDREMKALLFPLVEMLPQVRGKQTADSVVRDENIKVVEQASLSFIWFVLFLQDTVWDDLVQMDEQMCHCQGFIELGICHPT